MTTNDIILKKMPASRPPYLTSAGLRFVIFTVIAVLACLACEILNWHHTAIFCASAAALMAFIFAWLYAVQLRIWRALRAGTVHVHIPKAAFHCRLNEIIDISCSIQNNLPLSVLIPALRWHHSEHLEINGPHLESTHELDWYKPDHHDILLQFLPRSQAEITFMCRIAGIGQAAIYGIGMICCDKLGFFQSESHIECQIDISALPHYQSKQTSIIETCLSHTAQIAEDDIPENTRPWTNGDAMRRIAWRGFARHHDLQVWQPPRQTRSRLFCLIDTGDHMITTESQPPFMSPLAQAMVQLACVIHQYETATICLYGPQKCQIIANDEPPHKALRTLEKHYIKLMAWHPPKPHAPDHEIQWAKAASRLWTDFKLFRHVDFSQKTPDGMKIELQKLVTWARADEMSRALSCGNLPETKRIQNLSYEKLLLELIRRRVHPAVHSPLPQISTVQFTDALKPIERFHHQEQIQTLWFSTFSCPHDTQNLQIFAQILRKNHTRAVGVCLPMPKYSLNFSAAQGEKIRDEIILRMKNSVEFI